MIKVQFQVYAARNTVYLETFGRVWCVLGGIEAARHWRIGFNVSRNFDSRWNSDPRIVVDSLLTDSYRRSHPKFHTTTTGSESV